MLKKIFFLINKNQKNYFFIFLPLMKIFSLISDKTNATNLIFLLMNAILN